MLAAKAGEKVRLRIINAGSDTAFRVAVGGHRLTVTHTDGYPVQPITGDAVLIGMGERYDVTFTAASGTFPVVALPEGKTGTAMAILQTAARRGTVTGLPPELNGQVLTVHDLRASESVALPDRKPDRTEKMTIAGRHGQLPVVVHQPMHLHGHTFQVAGGGPTGTGRQPRPRADRHRRRTPAPPGCGAAVGRRVRLTNGPSAPGHPPLPFTV